MLTPLARHPYLTGMVDVAKIMLELERAWAHALPRRETAERDAVLRELWRLLQQRSAAREPMRLRVIRAG